MDLQELRRVIPVIQLISVISALEEQPDRIVDLLFNTRHFHCVGSNMMCVRSLFSSIQQWGRQILRTFSQTITWTGDWLEFD